MEILAWDFLGGIVSDVLMDVTETHAAKVGITSGENITLVGSWFLSLLRGMKVSLQSALVTLKTRDRKITGSAALLMANREMSSSPLSDSSRVSGTTGERTAPMNDGSWSKTAIKPS